MNILVYMVFLKSNNCADTLNDKLVNCTLYNSINHVWHDNHIMFKSFFLNLSNHCIWYTNYVKCQSYKMNIYLGWCHKKVVNYMTCPFWKNYFLVQNIIIWWRTFLPPPAQFRFFIVIPNLNLKWHQFKFWSCDSIICDVHFTKWLCDISSNAHIMPIPLFL